MKITTQDFTDSVFYPGAGKDIEPLLRLSNLAGTFLFTNLYLDQAEIQGYLDDQLANHPLLEVLETAAVGFDERTHFELHSDYRQHLAGAAFLNEGAREAYKQAFLPAHRETQWVIFMRLRRRNTGREIRLFYFTAEGLASYILLSHNGRYQPRVLCTIETKVLEYAPNDLILAMFRHVGSHPPLWLRGFQGCKGHPVLDQGKYLPDAQGAAVLGTDALFCHVAQDFAFHWQAAGDWVHGWGFDTTSQTDRLCKLFATDQAAAEVLSKPFQTFERHRIEMGDIFDVANREGDEGDWLVVTERLPDANNNPTTLTLRTWENLLAGYDPCLPGKICMDESIAALEKALLEVKSAGQLPKRVFFIPLGLEDQGTVLAEFLKRWNLNELCVVVRRPFDLIDLRVPAVGG